MPLIRGIFFDMGDTLLIEFPTGEEVFRKSAAEVAGLDLDMTRYADRYDILRGTLADVEYSLSSAKNFWVVLGERILADAGFGGDLEATSRSVWRRFDDIINGTKRDSRCPDEYIRYVTDLHARGYVLGIISNWNDRLFRVCERYGLGHILNFALASELVGVSKPHPEIFLKAVSMSGLPKEEVLFIGDNFHYDCAGAMRAGLRAVHLNVGIIHQAALVVQMLRRGIRAHILPGQNVPTINTILDIEPHLAAAATV